MYPRFGFFRIFKVSSHTKRLASLAPVEQGQHLHGLQGRRDVLISAEHRGLILHLPAQHRLGETERAQHRVGPVDRRPIDAQVRRGVVGHDDHENGDVAHRQVLGIVEVREDPAPGHADGRVDADALRQVQLTGFDALHHAGKNVDLDHRRRGKHLVRVDRDLTIGRQIAHAETGHRGKPGHLPVQIGGQPPPQQLLRHGPPPLPRRCAQERAALTVLDRAAHVLGARADRGRSGRSRTRARGPCRSRRGGRSMRGAAGSR